MSPRLSLRINVSQQSSCQSPLPRPQCRRAAAAIVTATTTAASRCRPSHVPSSSAPYYDRQVVAVDCRGDSEQDVKIAARERDGFQRGPFPGQPPDFGFKVRHLAPAGGHRHDCFFRGSSRKIFTTMNSRHSPRSRATTLSAS